MRAVGIMIHGGPEALESSISLKSTPAPAKRCGYRRTAVNPTDTMARNGSRASSKGGPAALRAGHGRGGDRR